MGSIPVLHGGGGEATTTITIILSGAEYDIDHVIQNRLEDAICAAIEDEGEMGWLSKTGEAPKLVRISYHHEDSEELTIYPEPQEVKK